jgi:uncharacterized protein YutE (UPF0331/DUF86 family)
MVDADKVRRLLAVLQDALLDLRRYRVSVTREALKSSHDTQHMVLHALYVAVQASVDLALHLAAHGGVGQIASYQSVFHRLAETGAVDEALSKRLAGWAGFRNVLAHFYAVIDYDRAYQALDEIGDLEEFAALLARKLDEG